MTLAVKVALNHNTNQPTSISHTSVKVWHLLRPEFNRTAILVNRKINVVISRMCGINSLPNDKILDWSKLKAFADDKLNVNEKFKFGLERVETSIFSFSYNVFKSHLFQGHWNWIVGERVKLVTVYQSIPNLNNSEREGTWKHCGKRRNSFLKSQ